MKKDKCRKCDKVVEIDSDKTVFCTDCKVYYCGMSCYDSHMGRVLDIVNQ